MDPDGAPLEPDEIDRWLLAHVGKPIQISENTSVRLEVMGFNASGATVFHFTQIDPTTGLEIRDG